MKTPAVRNGALACAERDWSVIDLYGIVKKGVCACRDGKDCRTPGKHPVRRKWQRQKTTDRARITKMFEGTTHLNYGILTGACSGLVVLDIDPRHDGDCTLAELEKRYGVLPKTPTARTGGGGRHLFFRHPGGKVKNSEGDRGLGRGVDVRGDGGYVVGPGSLHASGGRYSWEWSACPDDVPLAELPEAWVRLLRSSKTDSPIAPRSHLPAPRASAQKPNPPTVTTDPFHLLHILNGVPEGYRHRSIFVMCCSLRRERARPALIEALALLAASNCAPPLPNDEAQAIAHDVVQRYPEGATTRLPTDNRIRVMALIAASAGPVRASDAARQLGLKYQHAKLLMWRMANEYHDLVKVEGGGYVLAYGESMVSVHGPLETIEGAEHDGFSSPPRMVSVLDGGETIRAAPTRRKVRPAGPRRGFTLLQGGTGGTPPVLTKSEATGQGHPRGAEAGVTTWRTRSRRDDRVEGNAAEVT
jgi:hypothetical protein